MQSSSRYSFERWENQLEFNKSYEVLNVVQNLVEVRELTDITILMKECCALSIPFIFKLSPNRTFLKIQRFLGEGLVLDKSPLNGRLYITRTNATPLPEPAVPLMTSTAVINWTPSDGIYGRKMIGYYNQQHQH